MKKILITGANSYIGTSLETWLHDSDDSYTIDTLDMISDEWTDYDFAGYDTVFHVAGIAHVSSDPSQRELYYRVNRDLTIEVATRAKEQGVGQFVFMSSIIVYSNSQMDSGIITSSTTPYCQNFYGDSKTQAEQGIMPLASDTFSVVILRPPMIYGQHSRGNFPRLASLARKAPIFPRYDNKRSMLHIDNLCQFIKLMIDNAESGVFFPQNAEYVCTSSLVELIAKANNRNIILTPIFNWILAPFVKKINVLNKMFGDLVYEKSMSKYKQPYQIRTLAESIQLSTRPAVEE